MPRSYSRTGPARPLPAPRRSALTGVDVGRLLCRSVLLSALLPVLLTLAACGRGLAQANQYVVNDDTIGEENRIDPATVALDGGDFLVFWVDNTRGQLDVMARRFRPDLQPAGPAVIVNDDGGIDDQYGVVVSRAAGGRFCAAWLDHRRPVIAVYAQVFSSSDGTPVGANIELTADRAASLRDRPSVATDGRGYSLVCWEENTFAMQRIQAQILGESGQRVGAPFFAAPETDERPQRSPAVGSLPDGRWLLAWDETAGSEYVVHHRVLAADGGLLDPPSDDHVESIVDPTAGPAPALVLRASDALLLWTDNRAGTADVWGRWLNLDGTPEGDAALLRAQPDPSRDMTVRASAAPDGRFAVTWFGGTVHQEIPMIRYFDADRSPLSGDRALTDQGIGVVARHGQALPLANDTWVLAWSDDRSLSQQIYLRRVQRDGAPEGSTVAAWSVPASASQFLPDAASLPDGRTVVAWADLRGGSLSIFARLLDAEGRPAGQSFQVNTTTVGPRYSGPTAADAYWAHRPRVAASGTGTFIVTWSSIPGGGAKVLYGQIYDADAQPIGDNFLVADPAGELQPQSDPCPAMAADGRFAVVWRAVVPSGEGWDDEVNCQLFDPLGQRVGGIIKPVEEIARAASQLLPSIAISPFGDMLVAWSDFRSGRWELYRQRLALDGTPLEPANVRVSENQPQYNPAVATNGSAMLVVWEDRPNTQGHILGRLEILETARPGASGASTLETVDFIVNDFDSPPGIKNPRVAMDATGRFVVVWWDQTAAERRVWCRRYDARGNPLGVPYSLPAGDIESLRQYPSVAVQGERIQFVWGDTRRDRGWDVISRWVDWQYNGEPVPILLQEWNATSEADGLRLRWEVPSSSVGALFRLWRDPADEGGGPSPSARAVLLTPDWLSADGETGYEVLDRSVIAGETVFYYLESIEQGTSEYLGPFAARWDPPAARGWTAGPSPFRDRVELRPPDSGPVRLEIWGIAGRRIRTFAREAGAVAPIVWDGRDAEGREAASGIYFVRTRGASGREAARPVLRLVRLR